ncbi:DNA invertase Pin-like site-specific DNA recombinase [Bacillus sp. SLBN-46]|uniref:recombinase family protein n=1 Tax=Bacillus sp. SLBN-46 TaxID=3042283 RepID=UPI002863713A|nr:recombinase family protein [Bacillus sp. SLBN-46]MDR6124049.1 DNA invertase Pin-like site-specific DNA recombinase [Bacillus sp. SLBN-46]
MAKTVAYIRVSSVLQNLDRQRDEMLNLGIPEKQIYEDKSSGKDFDRISIYETGFGCRGYHHHQIA